jgi:alanine racemase
LKLDISYDELISIVSANPMNNRLNGRFSSIAFDSRKIADGTNAVFFALSGEFQDGHDFISDAYRKGVRTFIVSQSVEAHNFQDAQFLKVEDVLHALQDLAAAHRKKFNYPVIAITGTAGKTTVKEWLYHLLSPALKVIRSPKSYNSQLGVALSLLEMNDTHELAIIEAGISKPGEMIRLWNMIQPTHGIFTTLGTSHAENFKSTDQHLQEKLALFKGVEKTWLLNNIHLISSDLERIHGSYVKPEMHKNELESMPFEDRVSQNNALLAISASKEFVPSDSNLIEKIASLPRLALRLETFEGKNNCTIINDTYNLDLDALRYSLEYQLMVANGKKRVVIVGLDKENAHRKEEVISIIKNVEPDQIHVVSAQEKIQLDLENAVILIKGTRKADMQELASQFRLKKHKTYVEIDLTAIRNNLSVFKNALEPSTKILAMVKAQSYGSGLEKIAKYLEQQGIDYLGVAYADEGVELRKAGIQLPILVMNAEEESFEDCIDFELEPAIYSTSKLDLFIKELILKGKTAYPVHLKIETGMKRLGIENNELPQIVEMLHAQPEIVVKSIYSHLAESDNRRDKRFTEHQVQRFNEAKHYLKSQLNYSFDAHILNSEGIANYPAAQMSMVRLGIGMYGVSGHPQIKQKLKPVIGWYSVISQIKKVKKGESVGYSRSFIAPSDMMIAIVPVGYADGYRRSLSNGKGKVFIQGVACSILGRVCMDMVLVDLGKLSIKEGAKVEIIGAQQSLEELATQMDTIPYEVMTGISKRVHRIYIEE